MPSVNHAHPNEDESEDSFHGNLRRARCGERDALGRIIGPIRPRVVDAAQREMSAALRLKDEASDIANETLLDVSCGIEHFHGNSRADFWAWVHRIMLNNVLNRVRYWGAQTRDPRNEVSLQAATGDVSTPDCLATASSIVGRRARTEVLWQAIGRLSENHRAVIILRYEQGLELADVARSMNRSVDATKQLWKRALKSLARELNKGPLV